MTTVERIDNIIEQLNQLKAEILSEKPQGINPTAAEFLKEMWGRCWEFNPKERVIQRWFNNEIMFEIDNRLGGCKYLWVDETHIWKVLETKYGLSRDEIVLLIKEVLIKPLGLGDLIPNEATSVNAKF